MRPTNEQIFSDLVEAGILARVPNSHIYKPTGVVAFQAGIAVHVKGAHSLGNAFPQPNTFRAQDFATNASCGFTRTGT